MSKKRFAIIGCGLIGRKRGLALRDLNCPVALVYDQHREFAQSLAHDLGAKVAESSSEIFKDDSIDAVVIATAHDSLVSYAKDALAASKHVLVEKPAARTPRELSELEQAAAESNATIRVGFNHRFHPAFLKAKEIFDSGELGELMYIRAHYGHGGRLGYEKEWRAKPEISGGGELIDQGSHLIDLSRWFAGSLDLAYGHAQTFYWDMPVEDNGFMLLKSPDGRYFAHLHASCTEWKNLFRFEIFCQRGKLFVSGLGRSYGAEELTIYRMQPEMGPPPTETFTFDGEDQSWHLELSAFIDAIDKKDSAVASVSDAGASLQIINDVYLRSGFEWAQ